jgi:hypothetical protein
MASRAFSLLQRVHTFTSSSREAKEGRGGGNGNLLSEDGSEEVVVRLGGALGRLRGWPPRYTMYDSFTGPASAAGLCSIEQSRTRRKAAVLKRVDPLASMIARDRRIDRIKR